MKTIMLTCVLVFTCISISFANPVYRVNGEVIDRASVKMLTFDNPKDAEISASQVDGQVFKEQGQELYRVIWGNVKINDVVIISNVE